MTRSGFKRLWLLTLIVILGAAFYVYRAGEEKQMEIDRALRDKERLTLVLNDANKMSAALAQLDSQTMKEEDITKLKILRHLGLEESDLKFDARAPSERNVGGVKLYVRTYKLGGQRSYAQALEQADWLHKNGKAVVSSVEVSPGDGFGDVVKFDIEGVIYGLDKKN